jgi:hypothetical protein
MNTLWFYSFIITILLAIIDRNGKFSDIYPKTFPLIGLAFMITTVLLIMYTVFTFFHNLKCTTVN